MKTVTIQIGNSDDKLSQVQWSSYVNAMRSLIVQTGETHFAGGSNPDARWQNYCWVVNVPDEQLEILKSFVTDLRHSYFQTSVAVTVGETFFV